MHVLMRFQMDEDIYTIASSIKGKDFVGNTRDHHPTYKIKGNMRELQNYRQVSAAFHHGVALTNKGYFSKEGGNSAEELIRDFFVELIGDREDAAFTKHLAECLDSSAFLTRGEMIQEIYNRIEDNQKGAFIEGLSAQTCVRIVLPIIAQPSINHAPITTTPTNITDIHTKPNRLPAANRNPNAIPKITTNPSDNYDWDDERLDQAYIVDFHHAFPLAQLSKITSPVTLCLLHVSENDSERQQQFSKLAKRLLESLAGKACIIQCLPAHVLELRAALAQQALALIHDFSINSERLSTQEDPTYCYASTVLAQYPLSSTKGHPPLLESNPLESDKRLGRKTSFV